ncbi:MAG: hypothetical protein ACI901_001544, partial [Octadecabacter sp.]
SFVVLSKNTRGGAGLLTPSRFPDLDRHTKT